MSSIKTVLMWALLILVPLLIFILIITNVAFGSTAHQQGAHKQKLNRDDIYYEIVNDGDDHGNYIETYHVPNGRGGKVYCVVYSDKIGDGGGAGIDCDWAHAQ